MLHHLPRVAGLLAILASLVIAPSAFAATPAGSKAKERAYGKYCGAKAESTARKAQRTKCLDAMSKLATGRSSSPSKACKALSRKKLKGESKSAYARCVSEGAKLLKAKKRRGAGSGTSGGADENDDAADEGEDHAEDGGADEDAEADADAGAGDDGEAPADGDDDREDAGDDDATADEDDAER